MMTFPPDRERFSATPSVATGPMGEAMHGSFYEGTALTELPSAKAIKGRVDFLASHMQKQLHDHQEAMLNTNRVFEQVLTDLEAISQCFREALTGRDLNETRVGCDIDADRSIGILKILWHSLSFTTRGNSKPLALYRPGRPPLFAGRIVALHGDFQDARNPMQYYDFPEILQYEVASLYVPADPMAPAVMKIKHLGAEEHYLHQVDAARQFLMKTIEVICGGGFFHEHL